MDKRYKCECGTHEAHVELDEDPAVSAINLTIWRSGAGRGAGLWLRLKLAWQLLRTGEVGRDWVVLRPSRARRMGKSLIEFAEVADFRRKTLSPTVAGEASPPSGEEP
jgi:hypothetical protein